MHRKRRYQPNSLAVKNPDLVEQLIDKEDAYRTIGSHKKVSWKCMFGFDHYFKMTIADRARGRQCAVCAGQQIYQGYNDLATINPTLAQQFNRKQTHKQAKKYPEKNWATSPEQVTAGSKRWAVWDCDSGEKHWYIATVQKRNAGAGCPYCSGHRVLEGFNDIATTDPDIAERWNTEETMRMFKKQGKKLHQTKTPKQVSRKSNIVVVWNCENGQDHTYRMTVAGRTRGRGCPYCSNQAVLQGYNDLATIQPRTSQLFNIEQTHKQAKKYPEKNWATSPEQVTTGSNKRAIWNCDNGLDHWHEMEVARKSIGQGCAVCSGNQVFKGYNDLASLRPDVAKLWDYDKNKKKHQRNRHHPRTPEEVTRASNRTCNWICKKCHNGFERKVSKMTQLGATQLCPECIEKEQTSRGEEELRKLVTSLLPEKIHILNNDRIILDGRELDIYIPELQLAFEFNGDRWHSNELIRKRTGETAEEYHTKKRGGCAEHNIDLFFVWWSDWNRKTTRKEIVSHIKEIIRSRLKNKTLMKEDYPLLNILSKD